MNLETAKLVVFALYMEQYEGVTAKPPTFAEEMWHIIKAIKSRQALERALSDGIAAKFANYCRLWGRVEDGLSEELPAAGPAEAKKGDSAGAQQSESVNKEVDK